MPDDEKISELDAASALDGTELVTVVQGAVTKRTTAQDIADLGGGGGNWWDDVAPSGEALQWRNSIDDANIEWIKAITFSDPDPYDALLVGDPSQGHWVFDPFDSYVFWALGGSSIRVSQSSTVDDAVDGEDNHTTLTNSGIQQYAAGLGYATIQRATGMQLTDDSSQPIVSLTADGTFIFKNLPTSDPGVGSKIWNNAGTLKITAAA